MKSSDPTRRIALIEDDPDVARTIEQVLTDFGFAVFWCRSAGELVRRIKTIAPDLCIIDLGLPDMDGLELLQRLRQLAPGCAVLILTGRSHVSDRVMGLELGADDYVLKPFEPRELVARLRSILRRRDEARSGEPAATQRIACFDGWTFNTANHTLTDPAGEASVLSTAESELLSVFLQHPGRILQREQLLGGRPTAPTDRSIDVRISRLRRKLGADPAHPERIKTVYGAGYLFLAKVAWRGEQGD